LTFLPVRVKNGLALLLERSVFLPYRFALGWGPRSLLAERRAAAELARLAGRARLEDGALEAARENDRLRSLLGFRRRGEYDLLPATVVGSGRSRIGDLLLVEPEQDPGSAIGLVALTPDGLLGRVASQAGRTLRVECLAHRNVAVSVVNQRSREGGILRWEPGVGRPMVEGVPAQADWQPGDRVVTSGLGTAFPRGILVGWVEERRGGGSDRLSIPVRPAASAARAQEVFLLRPEIGAGEEVLPIVTRLFPAEPGGGARSEGVAGRPGVELAPAPVY
jgi:rod shape-determining protein MreC